MYALGTTTGIGARIAACALAASILAPAGGANEQPAATGAAPAAAAPVTPPPVTYMAQGWSAADRETFYTTSQGSHLIPYSWFKALPRTDSGDLFAADQLTRYGYLHNDDPNNSTGLPIGFVAEAATDKVGMTCAACHTGQLEYSKGNTAYVMRMDGAPAKADFQQFLTDLSAAASDTLAKPDKFDAFAKAVLGNKYSAASAAQLKSDFGAWVKQFAAFMKASLPASPWGPGRLDAFGMIFDRVAARDLGVDGNFKVADAPVRYPFLWYASRQDHTQWNGSVGNGLYVQGLARNTGEVLGVFADFAPKVLIPGNGPIPTKISYRSNSVDFAGLQTLEEKIAALKSPPWPSDIFGLKPELVQRGKPLFDQHCGQCHGEQNSPDVIGAWATPVRAVGTDPMMASNAARMSDPGIYTGAFLPPPAIGAKFGDPARTSDILASSVIGTLLNEAFSPPITPTKIAKSGVWRAIRLDLAKIMPEEKLNDILGPNLDAIANIQILVSARLSNMFRTPASADSGVAYESRVLRGIWAAAPYLHNGSVPNLWQLMTPPKDRTMSFRVGCRQFDPTNVGYVADQPTCGTGTFVADPNNANGNGNGGHDFGTDLSADERWSIIEYLKTL